MSNKKTNKENSNKDTKDDQVLEEKSHSNQIKTEELEVPEKSESGGNTPEKLSSEDEMNNLRDRHLRLRAEFDNYKKRSEKEFSRLLQYEGEEVIVSFLGIADDVQRMINSVDGDGSENVESLLKGMTLIRDKLHRRLSALKVEPFDSEGFKFDPEIHDAMMTQSSDEHDEGVVIQEFEKGYKYKDKVIRHAKVIVNAKEGNEE